MTAPTLTLTDWLLQQIAEDEERAEFALAHPYDSRYDVGSFDPARVLRRCEADRRIVEEHATAHECPRDGDTCGWWEGDECNVLRYLAAVYADSPGFQEDWRV